jgi:hypothetical protein|tara:strand:- start:1 stop:234 length:234 start_codon:yes stop_codon:yes gene_type:complete
MKKIILIVIASLMFANIGFAEMRLIEEKYLKGDKPDKWGYSITTICVDSYKFVMVVNREAFVQFFEERDGKSLPAKC